MQCNYSVRWGQTLTKMLNGRALSLPTEGVGIFTYIICRE
jgi:hypothetical protein